MVDIEHVVVLMLENRSFDCMLGRLYPNDPDYRGLTLNESNQVGSAVYGVWTDPSITAHDACIPDPDPGEYFTDMNMQLFGAAGRNGQAATMCGFAQSYATQPANGDVFAPAAVMHYFTPEQVPVISTLAKAFGVCDSLARLGPLPDLAEPLLCPYRHLVGLRRQQNLSHPLRGAEPFPAARGLEQVVARLLP